MQYLFGLGHQPHISTAELEAVFSISPKLVNNNYGLMNLKAEIDSEKLIQQLGGVIKIARVIKSTGDTVKTIVNFLNKNKQGKIHFSIKNKKLGLAIKKQLRNQGHSVRYIEPKNTATILHNNLIAKESDFTIVNNQVFITTAIQPFEDMTQRDYERPGSDNVAGMLPPKLAKIMINLSQKDFSKILLDPFCGSGTVLMEAAVMGYKKLLGNDLSAKAVEDTNKNLKWLIDQYQLTNIKFELFQTDAIKLHSQLQPNSVDFIVTEPYLGKPLKGRESREQLNKQTKELADLYIHSFQTFSKLLKPTGIIIFIIPKFKYQDDWIEIDCVEKIKKIGFACLPFAKNKSLLYHRPKQHLGRTIWRFKKF